MTRIDVINMLYVQKLNRENINVHVTPVTSLFTMEYVMKLICVKRQTHVPYTRPASKLDLDHIHVHVNLVTLVMVPYVPKSTYAVIAHVLLMLYAPRQVQVSINVLVNQDTREMDFLVMRLITVIDHHHHVLNMPIVLRRRLEDLHATVNLVTLVMARPFVLRKTDALLILVLKMPTVILKDQISTHVLVVRVS